MFNESGQIPLQKRADDGAQCLSGRYVKPNEAPHETAVRETKEEARLTVAAGDLVGVYTRKPGEFGSHCLVIYLYRCTGKHGTVEVSRKGEDVQYKSLNPIPHCDKTTNSRYAIPTPIGAKLTTGKGDLIRSSQEQKKY